MIKTQLFKRYIFLAIAIGILDETARIFYFHWTTWWFDVILHFLSGAFIGITILLLWSSSYNGTYNQKLKIIYVVFWSALIIGLLWEVLEVCYHVTFLSEGIFYWRDTISDIIADVCGAFFGALYSFESLFKKNLN